MPGPPVDLVDETFIVADRARLARRMADPALWLEWWPDLHLSVVTDRGLDGIRWSVAGALSGTAEIWLEPWRDGVIVHWILRARPLAGPDGDRLRHGYATAFKSRIHALKDDLEAGRPAGSPRAPG
ncbi:MAG: polyketide cyclase / dehydrase and lipid transport [Jiangellaceae bacterium]